MKLFKITIVLIFISGNVLAGDSINIPWEEFKKVYQESIEKKVLGEKKEEPFVYSINNAIYKMKVSSKGGECDLTLSGSLISGTPEPFTIFDKNIIVKNIIKVTGGSLFCRQESSEGIVFFPAGKGKFLIRLSFYIPPGEDNKSRLINLQIPRALKNSLSMKLSKDTLLVESPGIKDKLGNYSFSSRSSISIRFADKKDITKKSSDKIINLSKRFKTVTTPPIVLDSISYFTSFEETGTILSVLIMDVPPESGSFLRIKSLPDTTIWSFKLNSEKKRVYSSDDKDMQWIVPLSKGKTSHIELAMIRQSKKMGLQGRLEFSLPKMVLPSRRVNVAIALPERVELLSFEGPVNPATENLTGIPREFIGKPYYFSRSFYKGEGMNIAVSYKEPVKRVKNLIN